MGLSETLLQGLAEATCVGVFTTNERLTITGWNQWLETNSGILASEIIDRPLFEVFPELLTRRLDRYYQQAQSGQVVLLAQRLHGYLLPFSSGVIGGDLPNMPQSARIAPILDDGRVVGTVTMIEDVTERVVHETALRARAREQAAVAKLSQQALAGSDLNALFRETIVTLADVFKVKEDQVVILQSDIDTPPERSSLGAANVPIRRGKKPFGVLTVYKHIRRGFSEEDMRVLQSVANMLGFAVERIHLEHQLRQRADDLATEARRKDEFLAMLAHELRNPLAPIRNAVQIIRLTNSASPTLEATEIVDRQVQQMVHLVDDLLDVSRISRGKIQLRKEKVDLGAIVAQAVESVRPLIDSRKHKLTLTLAANPIGLYGDSTRLIQVLANLLNNAAKYTDTGGHIWLTTQQESNEAVIRVKDNGIGMRADLIPQVFDLFVQSDRALDRSEGGLGIGLTLARRLVDLHDGTLTASSQGIGLGSEFVVRLPCNVVIEPTQNNHHSTREPDDPSPSFRRRILIVDDNVDSAKSLAMLLRLNQHDVRVAHDGRAALAEVSASLPEFIFLDIGLPGMNGLDVARKLRESYGRESMILVAMTGYGQQDDRRQSQEAGFDGHLVKPIDLDSLNGFLRHGLAFTQDSEELQE